MTKIIISINPGKNFEKIGEVKVSSEEEIISFVHAAQSAKLNWKEAGLQKRLAYLEKLYNAFESQKEKIAILITTETGKPISQTRKEVSFFQSYNKWNLENASKILSDVISYEDEKSRHKIVYEPIGVSAILLPWNSPFGLFSWKVFTNLIVGNTVIVKHSEECSLTAKLIEKIVSQADLPNGVFNMIYGDGEIGEFLASQDIDLISFTGSSKVGKKLYRVAAKKFIKAIMDLGGSNPALCFEDANVSNLSKRVFSGRFANCGQNCDATKRLIVHENQKDNIIDALVKELENKKIGYPSDEQTYFGTLISKKQVKYAEEQLKDALNNGAKIIAQLKIPKNLSGAYFPPTILSNVSKDMKVWKEEVFAPILPVISFKTENEAIELANDTNFGLGATIFTKDRNLFTKVANRLHCGNIEHNNVSQWLPCNPFGGYKESGIGRENGEIGLRELCQIKVISESK